jgi:hypothetical protein
MTTKKQATTISSERIASSIIVLRGQRVILDRDLASIYGVSTGRLNESVRRNISRFPEDFMFQLSRDEAETSRSQSAILNNRRGANIKYLPSAFTEHGAIQVANILRSQRAIEMGIYVVRAFVHLRNILASNRELARQFEELERRVSTHDQAIVGILKTIRELMHPPAKKSRPIGFTADLDEK